MNDAQRVKIKTAYFDEDTNSICWTVILEDNKEADLVWLREEFGPTFNISSEIPISLIKEFCNNMIGKEINLVMDGVTSDDHFREPYDGFAE